MSDATVPDELILDASDLTHAQAQRILAWHNRAAYHQVLALIGEDEIEYSNLDGDAGYWEKHGRNGFRTKLREQAAALYRQTEED